MEIVFKKAKFWPVRPVTKGKGGRSTVFQVWGLGEPGDRPLEAMIKR